MPPKPNYKFQRAERDRAKKAAKEAKLQERREQATLKATDAGETETREPPPAQEAEE
ncbi:MAG: hypothetical protein ACJ8AW_13840 [Rhodopila sp.]